MISLFLFSATLFSQDNAQERKKVTWGVRVQLAKDAFESQLDALCQIASVDSLDQIGFEVKEEEGAQDAEEHLVFLVQGKDQGDKLVALFKKKKYEAYLIEVKLGDGPDATFISIATMFQVAMALNQAEELQHVLENALPQD